ncbi:MAG: nitrile hydratase subunit beta [Paracoccaceae bacterium]|nr:nitrile hydratase subunit beta [Paracoccaceae bacterium]
MTRFSPGDPVRGLELEKAGHVRIPYYTRTQVGRIEECCGTYLHPEELAVGNTAGQAIGLYRVTFAQTQLWPDDVHPRRDRPVLEIYDQRLPPAEEVPHAP